MNETALPAAAVEPNRSPASAPEIAKVMIVDDDPGTIDLVQFHLGEMGYRNVVACTDAKDALRLVVSEEPDVLLLDIVMPEPNGLEILRRIRDSDVFAHLPVIILTAYDDAQTKIRALELGATDFLGKPVNFVELVPRIRNARMVKAYYDQLKQHADELQRQVELKTASLKTSYAALERANFVLRRSCEAAEDAARAKSEFLANVSHEIRTPLTAIIGFTEALFADVDEAAIPPRCVELQQIILRNGRHLLQIVNDILDVANIEKGRLSIERVACSPSAILTEVARILRPVAEAKGLKLVVDTVGHVPDTIHSDPTRLRQILINLLNNAINFTEEGSVRVVAQLLPDDGPAPLLQFKVVDTGIGIEQHQLAEIFKPFTQARGVNKRKCGGTGLGLTICKYLVEELGGQIRVESRPEVGSTFQVTVATEPAAGLHPPAGAGPPTALQAALVQTADDTAPDRLSSRRILVAEDAPDSQRLIRLILERAGAEVTILDDGQAALETAVNAWRHGEPFDMILTDIQMPRVDGYSLAKRLRGEGYSGRIIALTANAMAGEREKCVAAGCDDYLSKPINRAQLLSMVAGYAPGPTTR